MRQLKNGMSSREAWQRDVSTQIQGTLTLCFVSYCVLISNLFLLKCIYTMNMKFARQQENPRVLQTSVLFIFQTHQPHPYQFKIQCKMQWLTKHSKPKQVHLKPISQEKMPYGENNEFFFLGNLLLVTGELKKEVKSNIQHRTCWICQFIGIEMYRTKPGQHDIARDNDLLWH